VSQRWFRGAMPPTLRSKMAVLMQAESWASAEEGADHDPVRAGQPLFWSHTMKRRDFLRAGTLLGGAGMLGSLGLSHAASGDYKALVCLYLNGGNDGNNTLIPTDGAYSDYAAARPVLALPRTRWRHSAAAAPAIALPCIRRWRHWPNCTTSSGWRGLPMPAR
jgi:hypothetical protein